MTWSHYGTRSSYLHRGPGFWGCLELGMYSLISHLRKRVDESGVSECGVIEHSVCTISGCRFLYDSLIGS